ncbi:MAG TPA: hypothetical protein VHY84_12500 [Bryobacteraceae bacterium]|nr:hypothetical protein [Bryobacteraceae bacterium]
MFDPESNFVILDIRMKFSHVKFSVKYPGHTLPTPQVGVNTDWGRRIDGLALGNRYYHHFFQVIRVFKCNVEFAPSLFDFAKI